jgi:ABC-type branched-subunit amino acid transport system ATPase component/ABC-type branched-subunit amino acid transport system permease subunit
MARRHARRYDAPNENDLLRFCEVRLQAGERMNLGSLVLGVLDGLTIGLLAVGLVLVYKSNRFLNLAHAQLGTMSALLLAKWVLDWGWNWWVAFAIAVGVGVLTGLVVERFLVGRLRRHTSSPVRLLLLSLGISQLLLALTYIPNLGPNRANGIQYPQPFHSSLRIGQVTLLGMDVLTALLVPVVVAGLALFMKYSTLGKEIRAAANNPESARLCGISVRRVSAIAWGLAGAFSAVSAVLQAPAQSSFNVAALGPYLLMLTLGAAALGAFVSLPAALAGGLVLGLVKSLVSAHTSSAADGELAAFVVILLIVLVRGRAIAQAFESTGAITDALPVTRIATSIRRRALVRYQRRGLAGIAFGLGMVWPLLPYFHTTGHEFQLTLILIYALVGVAMTMLLGWGGQVSLGNFAMVGLGAYLTARWAAQGWSLAALFIVIGLIGAAVMVAVGLPALRVRGLTLAVTTLGFAVIATDWLYRQPWAGSRRPFGVTVKSPRLGAGLGTPHSELAVYYVAFVVLAMAVAAAAALQRSSPGRLFVAVRDNERASAAFGVSPATVKLTVLAVSGFFSAVAGVLWAVSWKSITPIQFTADVSMAVIAIPVIGGLGSIGGAIAAATLLYSGTFFIGPHLSSLFGDFGYNLGFSLFLAGSGVTFTLLKFPNGVAGAAQAGWQRYLDRRAMQAEAAGAATDPTLPLRRESPLEGVLEGAPDDRLMEAQPVGTAPDSASTLPLRVTGVLVRFGGVVALDEPDITVPQGEIVGLIGANGAGKTTLMNVISGVIRPERGSVSVFGTEVVDLAPDFRAAFGLARSFQDASLFAGLTVTETIQVAIAYRHKVGVVSAMVGAPWARDSEHRTRRAATEIVARFGLGPWAEIRTAGLSAGTRRICDLAAQVAAEPKLILLDEPTAGVAQREAEAFGPLLRRIRNELDCSVLIVEHDMPLLMGVCDRIYALETGRVIAAGTPDEIRNNPRVIESYLGNQEIAIARSDRMELTRRTP